MNLSRPPRARLVRAAALLGFAVATVVHASDTQWWISDAPADYAGAESRGVVVAPDGALSLGPETATSLADSLNVVWSIVALGDGSVALAGDRGRIDRWTPSGGVRPWVRLRVGQVFALASDGAGGLVAGTGPGGAVYRISAGGDTALLARTGERYVWGLAPAGRGAWYAATGTRGRLLRIEDGKSRVVLDTDESNLVSLVSDGRGGVYAGGDSKGRVIHARADGSVRTVFDAPEDEVRSLAVGADGALYAAALTGSAVSEDEDEKDDASPEPARGPVTGAKAVVYRIVPDSAVTVWWTSPQPFVFALAAGRGPSAGILAATGNRAGVARLERANGASQWLAPSQGQVTALAVDAQGRVFAATSNPGALWRLGPGRADRGTLQSGVLDARRIARFGRLRWRGTPGGGVGLETRSGNTDTPDTTWSDWANAAGGAIASPPARYLQWRIALRGDATRIESVEAAWRERNLPPRLEDVVVAPQGQGFREGELQPRTEPVTQTLPGGQRVEYSIPSAATPRQLRDLPAWARGMRTVQWRATDPNADPLLYRIDVRAEAGEGWSKVAEDLEAPAFTWDTNTIPDGRYRLRVTASDVRGNAVGEERTDQATSEPFTVDNAPPSVTGLEVRGEAGAVRVQGRAEDQGSGLSRIEVAIDEAAWRPVTPDGGLTDDASHAFDARLDAVAPGEHSVAVRAVDRAGNTASRAARVTVTRPR